MWNRSEIVQFVATDRDIPPKWYWAVEDIIWNYKVFLEQRWYKINIVNTKNIFRLIKETVFVKNKILHFHSEHYLLISYFLNKIFFRNNKIFWTCHNWYITQWKESFIYKIIAFFVARFKNTTMISLSPLMEEYFVKRWFEWRKYIVQNGINTKKFTKVKKAKDNIIYLWNINENKWQSRFLENYNLEYKVDFVWPYLDKNINLWNHNYLWTWTKKEVFEKLWNYKVLVLLSESEVGTPLVIKEALAAWCSILTSKIWALNLEENDFIKILDIKYKKELEKVDKHITELVKNNEKNREKIWEYSQRFDWENIIEKYEEIFNDLKSNK